MLLHSVLSDRNKGFVLTVTYYPYKIISIKYFRKYKNINFINIHVIMRASREIFIISGENIKNAIISKKGV